MDELLPVKQAGPVVQWIGDECLVFDPRTAQAHLLNSKLAMLYQACDGKQRIETMAERLGLDLTLQGLAELRELRLVKREPSQGVSRRQFLTRSAAVAAVTLALPTAAAAASAVCTRCTSAVVCVTGNTSCQTMAPGSLGCPCPCTTMAFICLRTKVKTNGSASCATDADLFAPGIFCDDPVNFTAFADSCSQARSMVADGVDYACVCCRTAARQGRRCRLLEAAV